MSFNILSFLLGSLFLVGVNVFGDETGRPTFSLRPNGEADAALLHEINHANAADLLRLPQSGPVRAKTIMAHRPFRSLAELALLPQFGLQTVAKLRREAARRKMADAP